MGAEACRRRGREVAVGRLVVVPTYRGVLAKRWREHIRCRSAINCHGGACGAVKLVLGALARGRR
jgi:hypothetical protein